MTQDFTGFVRSWGIKRRIVANRWALSVGCGHPRHNDTPDLAWEYMDLVNFGDNVVFDLESPNPWPFPDAAFDRIDAIDVLEHVQRGRPLVRVVNEICRVLKPGGVVTIQVPDARYPHPAWTDPEHHGGFTELSFDYWVRGLPSRLCENYGDSKHGGRWFFTAIDVRAANHNLTFRLAK